MYIRNFPSADMSEQIYIALELLIGFRSQEKKHRLGSTRVAYFKEVFDGEKM